jgi:tetratricopeptide (TPR) repeat protein
MLALYQGEYDAASTYFTSALELYRSLEDSAGAIFPLMMLGILAEDTGDYDRAAVVLQEARAVSIESANTPLEATICYHQGVVAWGQGEILRATALLEEAIGLARESGSTFVVGWATHRLGEIARDDGDLARAAALLGETLAANQVSGDTHAMATSLAAVASLAVPCKQFARAARLFGADATQRALLGFTHRLPERAGYERALAIARAEIGEPAFASAWEAGRRLTLEDAAAEAHAVTELITMRSAQSSVGGTPAEERRLNQ